MASESGLSVGRNARRKRRLDAAPTEGGQASCPKAAKAADCASEGAEGLRFGPKGSMEATVAIRYILAQGTADGMLSLRQVVVVVTPKICM